MEKNEQSAVNDFMDGLDKPQGDAFSPTYEDPFAEPEKVETKEHETAEEKSVEFHKDSVS